VYADADAESSVAAAAGRFVMVDALADTAAGRSVIVDALADATAGRSVMVDALVDTAAGTVVTPTSRHMGAQFTPASLVDTAAARVLANAVDVRQSPPPEQRQ